VISRKQLNLFLALLLSGCQDPDVLEKHYDSYAQVVADHAIDRGWIPDWMPVGASDIFELHNVDTSESLLRFSFHKGSSIALPTTCIQAPPDQLPMPRYSRPWWPSGFAAASPAPRYLFLRCKSYHAAISVVLGEALVWR
jgi:hypothetical protein